MEEFSPNNYKDVIKKSNEIRNNNIKKKLNEGGSVSGLYYFRDKIEKFLDNFFKNPKNTESYNKERFEEFVKEKTMDKPDIKNLPNDPKARGADGYTSDVIQGIIDEEEAKKEANK